MGKIKIICVVGARPNFIKIAPIMKELMQDDAFDTHLVHTGQHYDKVMNDAFFRDLNIPKPDYNLGVGSKSHAAQTAFIMLKFEDVCMRERPDLVLVVGDVNSTIAAALVAKKLGIRVAHVEAGLRSFDMRMPEEINRILTDRISDYLFTTEESGNVNLKKEGTNTMKVHFVGNVMIDSLVINKEKIKQGRKEKEKYGVVTLHRPSNVDKEADLRSMISKLKVIAKEYKIIFPIHPRTKKSIEGFGLSKELTSSNIQVEEPLGYIDFLSLVSGACFVMTDSGGIQEETTYFKVPCITLRENTERPSTIKMGTNILGTPDIKSIKEAIAKKEKAIVPPLWDGHAAQRIVNILKTK